MLGPGPPRGAGGAPAPTLREGGGKGSLRGLSSLQPASPPATGLAGHSVAWAEGDLSLPGAPSCTELVPPAGTASLPDTHTLPALTLLPSGRPCSHRAHPLPSPEPTRDPRPHWLSTRALVMLLAPGPRVTHCSRPGLEKPVSACLCGRHPPCKELAAGSAPRGPRLAAHPPKKGPGDVSEKLLYRHPQPRGRPSAPQADTPGVGAEHVLPPAHHARVGALVDGVGNDAQVRVAQRQVAGVGELQGLLVLVPAAGRAEGWAGSRVPRPPSGAQAGSLTTLCLSCGGSSGRSGRSHSCPRAPAGFWSWGAVRWQPPWGRGTLLIRGGGGGAEATSVPGALARGRPVPDTQAHRSRSRSCWDTASS